jgi:hypothetical protein
MASLQSFSAVCVRETKDKTFGSTPGTPST